MMTSTNDQIDRANERGQANRAITVDGETPDAEIKHLDQAGLTGLAAYPPSIQHRAGGGLGATRWYLAVRPEGGAVRYAVYIDGLLVTSGHLTGQEALAAAQRLIEAGKAGPATQDAPDGVSDGRRHTVLAAPAEVALPATEEPAA